MRSLLNLCTWLFTLAAALTLIWLVQTFPASVTITGHGAAGGWQVTTSLAVAIVALLILLIATAYGMLLINTLSRTYRQCTHWLGTLRMPRLTLTTKHPTTHDQPTTPK